MTSLSFEILVTWNEVAQWWMLERTPRSPVGIATIVLAGVVIDYDIADPVLPYRVTIEPVGSAPTISTRGRPLVARLFGEGFVTAIDAAAAELTARTGDSDPSSIVVVATIDEVQADGMALVGRMATLLSLEEDADDASPWWSVEAAVLARRLELRGIPTGNMARLRAPRAAQWLLERGVEDLARVAGIWESIRGARRGPELPLNELIENLAAIVRDQGSLADRLDALSRSLDRPILSVEDEERFFSNLDRLLGEAITEIGEAVPERFMVMRGYADRTFPLYFDPVRDPALSSLVGPEEAPLRIDLDEDRSIIEVDLPVATIHLEGCDARTLPLDGVSRVDLVAGRIWLRATWEPRPGQLELLALSRFAVVADGDRVIARATVVAPLASRPTLALAVTSRPERFLSGAEEAMEDAAGRWNAMANRLYRAERFPQASRSWERASAWFGRLAGVSHRERWREHQEECIRRAEAADAHDRLRRGDPSAAREAGNPPPMTFFAEIEPFSDEPKERSLDDDDRD